MNHCVTNRIRPQHTGLRRWNVNSKNSFNADVFQKHKIQIMTELEPVTKSVDDGKKHGTVEHTYTKANDYLNNLQITRNSK